MSSSFDQQPRLPVSMQLMPIGAVVVIVIALLAGGRNFNPSTSYVHAALVVGMLATLLLAWRIQPLIVGCWYKPRYKPPQPYSELGAWWRALANAVLAVMAGSILVAAAGNALFGTDHSGVYRVVSHYETDGRGGACHGLDLQRTNRMSDSVHLCVARAEQARLPPGTKLEVVERSSWFGREVESYLRL